jgi:hypothetical protein
LLPLGIVERGDLPQLIYVLRSDIYEFHDPLLVLNYLSSDLALARFQGVLEVRRFKDPVAGTLYVRFGRRTCLGAV